MMPSEPDKKMDDLLRTYARKRREDAGEPQEMHPATRRLLQAEAAKLRPRESAPQRTPWTWLLARWPRVAFAVGVFAVLAVAVWNWIPNRGQSSSPMVMAKQEDGKYKEVTHPSASTDEELAPAKSQLGRLEQDKDFADRLKAEAKTPAARPLNEVQLSDSARDAAAFDDLKLKKDSTIRGMDRQPAPADGLQLAETERLRAAPEQQSAVRKLDAETTSKRFAAGQALSRSEPPASTTPPAGVNLAQKPGADASGTKLGAAYSAPGAPAAAAEPSSRLPIITQASPLTSAVPSSGLPGGLSLGAQRQVTTFNQITGPALPGPSTTSASLAFDTRGKQTKEGQADFGVAGRSDTGAVSVGDVASVRARATGAGGVLIAAEKNQPQSLSKQVYRFQRQVEPEKPAATRAKAVEAPAPASVLLTFDFEQDGDSVRMTDSDGSVYAGRFVTGAEISQARFAEIGEELNSPSAEKRLQLYTANGARTYYSKAGSGLSTTNRVFRANGTNRTYGQLVTIEALLSGESRAATLAGATAPPSVRPPAEPTPKTAGAAPPSATAAASEALKAERLVGRMRIGASDEVRLIAVPVAR